MLTLGEEEIMELDMEGMLKVHCMPLITYDEFFLQLHVHFRT